MSQDDRRVPQGRLGRLARLATVGARTGASMLLSKDGTSAAQHAAEVLGTLRGIAAKVGQMASYVDGVVPEEHRASYETALRSLRAAAPTSSPEAIRRAVEEELGAPLDRLFADWDDVPLASASIGQVHRATLADGRRVAVKVQHPGIARAVESDLENASVLEGMASALGARRWESKRVFEEIKQRFREELDYGLEAERQRAFRDLHAGDPTIHVPAVIGDRSARRVLTTELAVGRSLEEAATAPEPARRAHAETLWRFVFKGNLVGGMFNADPHPGNYLFQDDGRITFLDFGCVEPLGGERLEHARALHAAACRRDEASFARLAAHILETRGGRYEELAVAYSRRCFEPLFASPYRITRAYAASLAEGVKSLAMQARSFDDREVAPLPQGMLFMNRLQLGFYSVLARLDVEVDYIELERGFLRPLDLDI
ncbi:Ubiquinone biosynthesis monooxygenase UbiB [Minicystis rosea]|nr:Ubiquinone biosynthesis monooxygenase UbiB [Minicystis rosea]